MHHADDAAGHVWVYAEAAMAYFNVRLAAPLLPAFEDAVDVNGFLEFHGLATVSGDLPEARSDDAAAVVRRHAHALRDGATQELAGDMSTFEPVRDAVGRAAEAAER